VLAGNLAAELKSSGQVFVMGHAFSDFDSLGGALGVAVMARSLGVPAYAVVNKETTLALSLVEFAESGELSDILIPFEKAVRSVGKKSLAVLVDTHIPSMSDYPELFEKCEKRVIIDHHRLAAGKYDSDIKIYHSPTASSACEMITEFISYTLDDSKVSASLAQALLSGIMLDTKNFVIRSGARTFSAAAYLKERGANLVETKKLFNASFDDIKLKNSVVDSAEFYKNCAVACVPDNVPDNRLIAAKAADDLLGVSGVKASFVLYETRGAVSVSARSLGEINVQLIMEALGGGGHRTMAATRLENTKQEAEKMLYEAIDKMTESER
jgi:c-di-AMP phosphodiesterase-like protein